MKKAGAGEAARDVESSGAGAAPEQDHQPRERPDHADPPPILDPHAEIRAELWRWHLGRVFAHQFDLIARRASPEPDIQPARQRSTGGDGRVRWSRTRIAPGTVLGLAAVKHMQGRDQRRQAWHTERGKQVRELFERRPAQPPERPHVRHGRRGKSGSGGSICPICRSSVRFDSHLCAS